MVVGMRGIGWSHFGSEAGADSAHPKAPAHLPKKTGLGLASHFAVRTKPKSNEAKAPSVRGMVLSGLRI